MDSLPPDDREKARAVAIDKILAAYYTDSAGKPLTSNTPGLTYGMQRTLHYPNAPCYQLPSVNIR
jgi:hypothetical protein